MHESYFGMDLEHLLETVGLEINGTLLSKLCLDSFNQSYADRRASLVSACERFGDVCDLGVDRRPMDDPLRASPW